MKWVAAAVILVIATVAPLALAQENNDDSSTPKLEVAVSDGALKDSVSIIEDESFWVRINGMEDQTHTVKLVDPDSGEAALTVSDKEFDSEDNWAQIFLDNYEHSLRGEYQVEVEGISAENPPTVTVTAPLGYDGHRPRGFRDWVGRIELSSITRNQAAALAAVDRQYINNGFNPIPEGETMSINTVVAETRDHAKNQNNWAEYIQEEFELRVNNGIEPSDLEGGGFYITTQGTFLTDGTPNRDPVSSDVASQNENIEAEDDCYADYAYRPRDHQGFASYSTSAVEAANTKPYSCPGYMSSISDILPTQEEATNPETYCPDSLSEEECMNSVIRPTCENGAGPGEVCQAMLSDTVTGAEDFGKWRNYCNQNFNKGDVKLNATEIVSCMQGCYGTAGIGQNGNFRQPEPQNAANGMNCGELVQNFCSNTKYASYIPKSNSESPNTCEVSLG